MAYPKTTSDFYAQGALLLEQCLLKYKEKELKYDDIVMYVAGVLADSYNKGVDDQITGG